MGLQGRELGDLRFGSGEADLKSFDLVEPAFAFGFGNAGEQVVVDVLKAALLSLVGAEHRAAYAGVTELPSSRTDGPIAGKLLKVVGNNLGIRESPGVSRRQLLPGRP